MRTVLLSARTVGLYVLPFSFWAASRMVLNPC
jgi:hypothetical protein